jgi:hypothetical protein
MSPETQHLLQLFKTGRIPDTRVLLDAIKDRYKGDAGNFNYSIVPLGRGDLRMSIFCRVPNNRALDGYDVYWATKRKDSIRPIEFGHVPRTIAEKEQALKDRERSRREHY